MNSYKEHATQHSKLLKEQAVRTELMMVLYKLGIKSAKPNTPLLSSLNDLFKQVYATGITDIMQGVKPGSSLFNIDPVSYNTWKSNGK